MTHVDLDDLAALVLDPDDVPTERAPPRRVLPRVRALRSPPSSDVRRRGGRGRRWSRPPTGCASRCWRRPRARRRTADADARPAPLPADDRRPAAAPAAAHDPRLGRRARRGLALVAGLGLGRLTVARARRLRSRTDPGTVVAAADLTALDSDADRGVASAVSADDTITLRVERQRARRRGRLPRGVADQRRRHPHGRPRRAGRRATTGEFQVPRGLIDEGYRIVDISVEPDDGDPTHSGVSLARGELA